jgi:ribosome recycling factor
MADEDIQVVLDETKEEMEKALKSLRIDLQKVRTGRANPALLDGLQVDYYGTPTPLQQLANLGAPDPRLIVISPYDKGAIGEIEKAIRAANLGLTPQNDGKLIRIPIPDLTEQRRRDLVKHVKKIAEEFRVSVRAHRHDALEMMKELHKEKELTDDDLKRDKERVEILTKENVDKVDKLLKSKEDDIMAVCWRRSTSNVFLATSQSSWMGTAGGPRSAGSPA